MTMRVARSVLFTVSILLAAAGWLINDLSFLFPREKETLEALSHLKARRIRQISREDGSFSLLYELWPRDDPDFQERTLATHIGLGTCYTYSGAQSGNDCDLVINLQPKTADNGWPISHAVASLNQRIEAMSIPWRWGLAALAVVVIIGEKVVASRQKIHTKEVRNIIKSRRIIPKRRR